MSAVTVAHVDAKNTLEVLLCCLCRHIGAGRLPIDLCVKAAPLHVPLL
jgi:hypothetical protein